MRIRWPLTGSIFGRVTLVMLGVGLGAALFLYLTVSHIVRAESEATVLREVSTDMAGLRSEEHTSELQSH